MAKMKLLPFLFSRLRKALLAPGFNEKIFCEKDNCFVFLCWTELRIVGKQNKMRGNFPVGSKRHSELYTSMLFRLSTINSDIHTTNQ